MSLESIFRLSVVMSMIDHLSKPMAHVASGTDESIKKIDQMNAKMGELAQTGAAMMEVGNQIVGAVLAPVEATFATRRALGELTAMGVEDLSALERASTDFSNTWAGTTKSDFLTAAIDIKGGIDSLTEEGIAKFTELSGVTAKATGSSVAEMTSLFATGYGIYKDYYDDLSDGEFAEIFSAGIAQAILTFKASGSSMAQSITSLGAAATTANVPLEEQLTVLGMLQATMSGSEAGTKYRAFLRTAVKAGQQLGLSFVDANNQMLSMPEILDILKSKYGETLDAVEKRQIQRAFGSDEAVALLDLMYSKTDDLQENILTLYGSMGAGAAVTQQMADAINQTEPERYQVLQQQIHNVKESIGTSLLPTVNNMLTRGSAVLMSVGQWIEHNQALVAVIMQVVLGLGIFLSVGGTLIAVISGAIIIFGRIKAGLIIIKGALLLAKGALVSLVGSVWSFTAALLANPITWVVIGIVALIAAIALLYNKCEWFRDGVNAFFGGIRDTLGGALEMARTTLGNMQAAYEAHGGGIKGAAAAAMVGVQAAFSAGFNLLDSLTGGWLSMFFESGKKIMTTFGEGIKSGLMAPVNAVRAGLQKIRNMLPFSDAKEGPLSTLTLSGQRTMTTYADGLSQAANVPAEVVRQSLEQSGATLGREPEQRRARQDTSGPTFGSDPAADSEGSVIVEKLFLNVDFSKIKELPQLLKLIREIESFSNANGGAIEIV
jgi:phage tail tape measure protein, TP901 family, core region